MLIAHISAFHVVPAPALCYGFSDTRAGLRRAIEALNAMDAGPDLVLATGDIVDEPSAEAYVTARSILDELRIPLVILPGNHDDRRLLADAFPDHGYLPPGGGKANFVREFADVRLVAFDAVVAGKEYAAPDDIGLDWLSRTLDESAAPTMIAMHHPPMVTGLAFMDAIQPAWPDRMIEIITTRPHVRLIVCGHVHRIIDGSLGSTRIATAASTGHQFAFATDLGIPPRLSAEPAMLRLHHWHGGNVTSFVTPVERSFDTFPFEGIDEANWRDISARLRAGDTRPDGATVANAPI